MKGRVCMDVNNRFSPADLLWWPAGWLLLLCNGCCTLWINACPLCSILQRHIRGEKWIRYVEMRITNDYETFTVTSASPPQPQKLAESIRRIKSYKLLCIPSFFREGRGPVFDDGTVWWCNWWESSEESPKASEEFDYLHPLSAQWAIARLTICHPFHLHRQHLPCLFMPSHFL